MAEEKKNKGGKGKFVLGALVGAAAAVVAGKAIKARSKDENSCDCDCDCGDDCDCEECDCDSKDE